MSDTSLRFFTQSDCPADALAGERITVLGYGNLGRSFCLNLRDAGQHDLLVGNIEDDYAKTARADGFNVVGLAEATRARDIVVVLLPDEVIPEVYAEQVAPHLSPNCAVVFASGY